MKKKVLLMGLAAVMVMGAVVGGSLAAGQASAENPVTAPLAAATLNIEWTGGKSDPVTLAVTDKTLMPADEIEVKDGYKVDNTGSVDAYVKQDLELVKEVIAMDDKVDELFLEVRDEIAGLLKSDAVAQLDCMDMLMIAKYYERIGDHATNIAEWVEFSITGMHKDVDVL